MKLKNVKISSMSQRTHAKTQASSSIENNWSYSEKLAVLGKIGSSVVYSKELSRLS